MKTCARYCSLVSMPFLLAVLLPQHGSSFSPNSPTGVVIPFAAHTVATFYDGARSVYATDMDGDGDVDILGAASSDDEITWWENDGNEGFSYHIVDGSYNSAHSVYATDLDGDGDVDVLGAAFSDDDITWWENDGSESFTEHTIDGDFNGAASVYAADLDGDGDVDVLGAAYSDDDITWWENDGSQGFTGHTIDGSFDGAGSVYAIDLDSDGDVDVLGTAETADDVTWWENDGSGVFTGHTIAGDFNVAYAVHAADLDGDGDVDVLGAAWGAGEIAWWENDGEENFIEHIIADDLDNPSSVYASDVDGDGDVDVLGADWRSPYHGDDILWWVNDGNESFTERVIDSNFDGANSVFATDVDGDGDVDILGAAGLDESVTWWEQGDAIWSVFLPALFSDAALPASAPVLDDISNPDGDGTYDVRWSAVENATAYVLHEDDNAVFSSPVVKYSGPNTSTTITDKPIGTWYYRVKATSAVGSSDWSEAKSVEVTVEPPPPPCPDPGAWSGSTNQGLPIDFTVAASCEVADLTIEYLVTCPAGLMWKIKTFDYYTDISDDSFDYDDDGDPTVHGDFGSQASATGTWSSAFFLPGIGNCSGSGSWSASAP